MAFHSTTVDDANEHVHESTQSAMDTAVNKSLAVTIASKSYQGLLKFADICDALTDNVAGRVSGKGYTPKSFQAMVGFARDVKASDIHKIMTDKNLSLGEKFNASRKKFSNETMAHSAVAAGVYFGKTAPIAAVAAGVGIAAAACFSGGALAVAAGAIAYKGSKWAMKSAATYFLTTHQGHAAEMTAAQKIVSGASIVKNLTRFGKTPPSPELVEHCEMVDAINHGLENVHDAHHGHHHDHHHETALETFKSDAQIVTQFAKDLVTDPKAALDTLWKGCMETLDKVNKIVPIYGVAEKFADNLNEIIASEPEPQATLQLIPVQNTVRLQSRSLAGAA